MSSTPSEFDRIKQYSFTYNHLGSFRHLSKAHWVQLCEAVLQRFNKAYAPYSGFRVSAGVLLADGTTVFGTNQENAAYPSGLCAERVALFSAAANFPETSIEVLCVAAQGKVAMASPVTPCGACRQVMLEYEHKQQKPYTVLLVSESGETFELSSAETLLPLAFSAGNLTKVL